MLAGGGGGGGGGVHRTTLEVAVAATRIPRFEVC